MVTKIQNKKMNRNGFKSPTRKYGNDKGKSINFFLARQERYMAKYRQHTSIQIYRALTVNCLNPRIIFYRSVFLNCFAINTKRTLNYLSDIFSTASSVRNKAGKTTLTRNAASSVAPGASFRR